MREYETVVITKADLPESRFNQTGEKIKTLIEKHDGHLFFARNMGRKSMAFPIKKQTKGVYTCFDYAAQGNTVSELERMLGIDDAVLRFLTVLKNEEIDVETRAAEIVARGEDASVKEEGIPSATPEVKVGEKVEVKVGEKVEVKVEEKVEVKVEEKVEVKVEEKAETKTEEKAETKTEEKAETKTEEKTDEADKAGKEA